ncbi:MAG: DMT family transporter [Pseudomonadota bacterium]|nr:DMT family transporter [Pseudomonadota bacterium]
MSPQPAADRLGRLAPAAFVLLWSTGFIAGKAGIADSGPLHFLFWRFVIVGLLLAGAAVLRRSPWPRPGWPAVHVAVAGLLVHAGYLGGVFTALRQGLGAGQVALVVGLQPLLTAVCAGWLLGERVGTRRWIGLGVGLAGVFLVLLPRLQSGPALHQGLPGLPAALLALLAISLGTVYQKRHCRGMDLRSGGAVQYLGCALLFWFLMGVDDPAPHWTPRFVLALSWLVLVLSVGAVGLLFHLLQRGAASQVASLFYLVPPVTVLMGMALFGEQLTGTGVLGMVLVVAAVALAS